MNEPFVTVPLGGNSFITNKPQSREDGVTPEGWERWNDPADEYHIYFKIARPATLRCVLLCRRTKAPAVILAGAKRPETRIALPAGATEIPLGSFKSPAGYVDVAVRGESREGGVFAFPTVLRVYGVSEEDMASYAPEKAKKDFYWIRRGPSVHCSYDLSAAGEDVEWFYNEARIDPGEDPHGTYGMAIGFHGGYYGMQVCDGGKKKLLFSVWAPYATDDPSQIPEEKRVKVLRKHPLVHTGEFGNEGSGGQSFMDYDWVSGQTCRFLCRIRPAADGKTEFTSYFFFPETGRWELFCSFLRPETQTWFKGAYSFLESFLDVNGHRYRRVRFSNAWAVTVSGKWIPIDRMRLTGDMTARNAWRQDYGGGERDGAFYLNNCGFFDRCDPLDTVFTRDRTKMKKPEIDLGKL